LSSIGRDRVDSRRGAMAEKAIYSSIIKEIFRSKFKDGMREIEFWREDIIKHAKKFRIRLPKNLGDLIYSFRYRKDFPEEIMSTAGEGETWIIRPAGRANRRYK
jgi:hypothetical protein